MDGGEHYYFMLAFKRPGWLAWLLINLQPQNSLESYHTEGFATPKIEKIE